MVTRTDLWLAYVAGLQTHQKRLDADIYTGEPSP